jgi:prophage maintenance system killer protein
MRLFLLLNGRDIAAPPPERVMAVAALSEGRLSAKAMARWIRRHLVKAPKD